MKALVAGGAYYGQFVTSDTTGAAANATGTPVATATKNGTDDAGFTLTVTNISTGRYKITGTVPSGYVNGDTVQVSIAATVDSIAIKSMVDEFLVVLAVAGTSAEYQQVAREAHRCSGTVYHVKYSGSESMGNDALAWSTADATAGAGVATDVAAATAGDVVLIGAGTFALGAQKVQTPTGVVVRGAGSDVTVFTGTSTTGVQWRLASNSLLQDFTLDTSAEAGAMAMGLWPADPAATKAVLRNLRILGDLDALYLSCSSVSSLSVYDCVFNGKVDSVAVFQAAHVVHLFNCQIQSFGPTAGSGTRGVNVDQGTVYLWNCDVVAQDGTAGQVTTGLNATTSGNIVMIGGRIRTYNAAGTDKAAVNSGTGKIVLIGVDYDRTKTTGTITDVARVVTNTSGQVPSSNAALAAIWTDAKAGYLTGPVALEATATAIKAKTDLYPYSVTPLATTVSAGAVTERKLVGYRKHRLGPYVFTVVDSAGAAVNLNGKTVRFEVGEIGSNSTPAWSYSSTGSEIVISGASNNIVTVSASDTYMGTPGIFQYRLVNHTNDIMLDIGTLRIVPGVAST